MVAHARGEQTRGVYWRKSGHGPTSGDAMCPAAWNVSLSPRLDARHARAVKIAAKGDRIVAPKGHTFPNLGNRVANSTHYHCASIGSHRADGPLSYPV